MLCSRRLTFALAALWPWVAFEITAARAAQDSAASFVDNVAKELAAVIDSNDPPEVKHQRFLAIIENSVDVDGIARFCLGRFWRQASPQQQREYLALFRQLLLNAIIGRLQEYKGVKHTIGRTIRQSDNTLVQTVIVRPGQEPAHVDWVVADVDGKPKIEDLLVEGTSLRITQRSDYSSFLLHNNSNVQALIDKLRQMLANQQQQQAQKSG